MTHDEQALELAKKRASTKVKDFNMLFGSMRSQAAGDASRQSFLSICKIVEDAALIFPDRTKDELIPYLTDSLSTWPSSIRQAPLMWIQLLAYNALPLEALHLVSALVLTPAMVDHSYENPDYERLITWFKSIPEDSPTLDGLSMSYLYSPRYEWAKDKRNKMFHAVSQYESRNETYYHDSDDLHLLLGSPLSRELKVFDAAFDDSYYGPWQSEYSALDGRDLEVSTVFEHIPSTQLEAINLSNHVTSFDDLRLSETHPALKVLSMGGIFPPTDKTIANLVKAFPNLETLSYPSGTVSSVYDEDFDFDGYDYDGRVWNFYKASDRNGRYLTTKGVKALNKLKALKNFYFSSPYGEESENLYGQKSDKALESLDARIENITWGAPDVWSSYFDE